MVARRDGEAHRPDEADLVDLPADVDFDLILAGSPATGRREQLQVAAFVLERHVHHVFSNHAFCIAPFYVLRLAAAEDLIGFVMRLPPQGDGQARGVRTGALCWTDRDYLG